MKYSSFRHCMIFLAGIALGMHVCSNWNHGHDIATQTAVRLHDVGTQTVENLNDYVIIEYV